METMEYLEQELEKAEAKRDALLDELNAIDEDLDAFGAPSECCPLAVGDRWNRYEEADARAFGIARQLKAATGFEYYHNLCHHDYPAERCQECHLEELDAEFGPEPETTPR